MDREGSPTLKNRYSWVCHHMTKKVVLLVVRNSVELYLPGENSLLFLRGRGMGGGGMGEGWVRVGVFSGGCKNRSVYKNIVEEVFEV